MKKLDGFKVSEWKEVDKIKKIFGAHRKSVSPSKMIVASNFLTFHKQNKKKVHDKTLKQCANPLDLIKYERITHDSVKKLQQTLVRLNNIKKEKEEMLEIDIDSFEKNPMGLKDKSFEKKLFTLSTRNNSFARNLLTSECTEQSNIFDKRFSDGKLVPRMMKPSDLENSTIRIKSHLKTHLYTECLNTEHSEPYTNQSDQKDGKKSLFGQKFVNGLVKCIKIKKLNLNVMKSLQANSQRYTIKNDIEKSNYNENNGQLDTMYLKLYKNDTYQKTQIKNTLERLKVPKEWKAFARDKYDNYNDSLFTRFLTEKNFIGRPY